MTEKTKSRLAYAWLWIWLLIVTVAAGCFYFQFLDAVKVVISEIPILLNALEVRGTRWITTFLLLPVGGVLICWRVVKVIVLHGAPLKFGMRITSGRQDNGLSGRMVTIVWIGDESMSGDTPKEFWFMVTFRAHPTSDKLMRSRLEVLAAALLFGRSLVIQESRIFFPKHSHSSRRELLVNAMSNYLPQSHIRSSFERELLREMKAVVKEMKAVVDSLTQMSRVNTADGATKEEQSARNEQEN